MSSAESNTAALNRSKLFDVSGWVALVSGGGTGIGLMAAQALAANGAKVYITGRRAEPLEKAASIHSAGAEGQIIPLPGYDITSKDSIAALVKEIEGRERALHVLVNNAGIDGPTRTVEKAEEGARALKEELWKDGFEDWEAVYKTNVIGHYFTTIGFLPLLSEGSKSFQGVSSSVINISSISGITNKSQHHIPYNVSKAASIQLTQLLAQELHKPGVKVRVNTIAPGIFPSEMTTSPDDTKPNQKSEIPAGGDYGAKKGIPAGRPGRDEDMAQAVLHFATNQYAVGQALAVDGGYLLVHG